MEMIEFLSNVKDFGLKRAAKVFAAVLVLLSLVFSHTEMANAKAFVASGESSSNPPGQVQPYEGGMNNFKDVDPNRLEADSVDAKAKALKDQVERNINQKSVDSVDQYVENFRTGTPLNERVGNIGDDLRQSAEDTKQGFQELGERGSKNLKRNVTNAPDAVSRTVDQAKTNAKEAAKDLSGNAR